MASPQEPQQESKVKRPLEQLPLRRDEKQGNLGPDSPNSLHLIPNYGPTKDFKNGQQKEADDQPLHPTATWTLFSTDFHRQPSRRNAPALYFPPPSTAEG